MRSSLCTAGVVVAILGLLPPLSAGEPGPAAAEVRAAVARALPLIQKGTAGHMEKRTCFACHNQAVPILAMTTARKHGFAARDEDVQKNLEFITTFLGTNRENYLKGKGTGGQADTAGYALFTLDRGGWKPDETTAAVTEYLLLYQKDLGPWRATSNRPPSEASQFTTNYLGLRGLQKYGTPEQKERIEKRTGRVREWLLKTPAQDNEDRVFRLGALKLAGADDEPVRTAAKELLRAQQDDGGWAQLDGMASDAYATGSALVLLHEAGGLATTDTAYRRGLQFLLDTQLADGTWLVRSRSRPFQTYYESGFPHGNYQFISIAGSSWATTALALACPPPKVERLSADR